MEGLNVNPERISMGSINPREDLGDLGDLVRSMKERHERGQRAVILPLLVRKLENNEVHDWEIIDGKRRLQGALMLRLPEVPIVEETDTESVRDLMIISYLANENRKDFNWIERAKIFKKLHDEIGMTQGEIGKEVGLSQQRVSDYIYLLEKLNTGSPVSVHKELDMETTREIVNKCPDEDIPELIQYAINNNTPRDEMRKILFALRNFNASQTVVKDFHEGLYNELQAKYHPYRFNPRFLALYDKEKILKTGDLQLTDKYLDMEEYPTRDNAEEHATKYHGRVISEIHRDGWHLRVYPYNMEELDKKFAELVEKFS